MDSLCATCHAADGKEEDEKFSTFELTRLHGQRQNTSGTELAHRFRRIEAHEKTQKTEI